MQIKFIIRFLFSTLYILTTELIATVPRLG